MAHDEPPHPDLYCLQIQHFYLSLVLKVLKVFSLLLFIGQIQVVVWLGGLVIGSVIDCITARQSCNFILLKGTFIPLSSENMR